MVSSRPQHTSFGQAVLDKESENDESSPGPQGPIGERPDSQKENGGKNDDQGENYRPEVWLDEHVAPSRSAADENDARGTPSALYIDVNSQHDDHEEETTLLILSDTECDDVELGYSSKHDSKMNHDPERLEDNNTMNASNSSRVSVTFDELVVKVAPCDESFAGEQEESMSALPDLAARGRERERLFMATSPSTKRIDLESGREGGVRAQCAVVRIEVVKLTVLTIDSFVFSQFIHWINSKIMSSVDTRTFGTLCSLSSASWDESSVAIGQPFLEVEKRN
jgi:hypothetical protein